MRVLICDNDEDSVNRCREQLNELAEKNNISVEVQSVSSGKEFLFYFDSKYSSMDVIYLDIHMPDMNGLEAARRIRDRGFHMDIVFYTSDASQAADAFDVEALNYIVKNKTSKEKFEQVFLKAYERSQLRDVEYIMLSCAGEHLQVPIDKIRYFEVRNRIVTVYYQQADEKEGEFEFYSSLAKLEEFLYKKGFVRIHSSYLVNERFVLRMNKKEVILMSGETLPVGRAYTSNLIR
jgi:DNA-binding LytR/AlgR family response regulator